MHAMILKKLGSLHDNPLPLEWAELPDPIAGAGEVVIRVSVCGICHTELDEIEGRTPPPHLPIIPGHQVIGRIEALDEDVKSHNVGDRVGVAWIYSACGECDYCKAGKENLCMKFVATGRDVNGGYAELMTAPAAFVHSIPDVFTDAQAAPMLCAGAVGFRAICLTGLKNGENLGLMGFGASGSLVLQLARNLFPESKIFVFARDDKERAYAHELGAAWTGSATDYSPEKLQAIIDTTPAWTPILQSLENLKHGGRLVINAIRKEEVDKRVLLSLDYARHLWLEKEIKTVANVTRFDVTEFLTLAAKIKLSPEVQEYALKDANKALNDIKIKSIRGAKVLRVA